MTHKIGRKVMINRSTIAFSIAVAAWGRVSPAFAQSRDAFGPVLPMIFDGQGGRHYCVHGYYGPFDPPIAPQKEKILVCPPLKPSPRAPGGAR